MALPPQKFREIVFQLLYGHDMGPAEEKDMVNLIMQELAVTKKSVMAGQERVHALLSQLSEIDNVIGKTVHSYEFERIQSVERNILRLGAYELLFDSSIPSVVAIAEAVRLAKKFGTPESASFVNAVLDAIYKSSKGEAIDIRTLEQQAEALKQSEKAAQDLQEGPSPHEKTEVSDE